MTASSIAATPTPATFPRAALNWPNVDPNYFAQYRHDCRPTMRRWLVETFSPFGEFTLPFGALNMTTDEILDDAMLIAEHVAIKAIGRELNANERRLMWEVVRDLMCAAITKRDAGRDLSQPKMREVL